MTKRSSDELPEILSESDTDGAENTEQVRTHKKRKTIVWNWIGNFSDHHEAENAVALEKIWSKTYSNNTKDGRKCFYRCTRGKKRVQECSAVMYLLYDAKSDIVKMYKSASDHDCDKMEIRSFGMSDKLKKQIVKLLDYNMKPKRILLELTKLGGEIPTMNQLNNFLSQRRKGVSGAKPFSLGDLQQLLDGKREIPDSDTAPFIVDVFIPEDVNDSDEVRFCFFVSSKRLLRNIVKGNRLHADSTYKLIWEGFPVLIIGTTDQDKSFHMAGLGVCSHEKEADFAFCFASIKKGVLMVCDTDLKIDTVISDAAHSIQKGFKTVFGQDATVLMCWAHVIPAVQLHAKTLIPKAKQNELLEDLRQIQVISSPEIFDAVMKLFLKKWESYPNFIEYFTKQWIHLNPNWYEGAKILTPSTNNALEATNRVIKDDRTFRERLPLPRFIEVLYHIIDDWGLRYDANLSEFSDVPTIHLPLWTKSYQWAKLNKKIQITRTDNHQICKVPANSLIELVENSKTYINWETFDEFKEFYFNEWTTTLSNDPEKWSSGTCTCPTFMKEFICKHVVGIALRLKYVQAPFAARHFPIGEKRKRGRPAKAKLALHRQ